MRTKQHGQGKRRAEELLRWAIGGEIAFKLYGSARTTKLGVTEAGGHQAAIWIKASKEPICSGEVAEFLRSLSLTQDVQGPLTYLIIFAPLGFTGPASFLFRVRLEKVCIPYLVLTSTDAAVPLGLRLKLRTALAQAKPKDGGIAQWQQLKFAYDTIPMSAEAIEAGVLIKES